MPETKVGIILEAEDRATRQIKEVGSSLQKIQGRLDNMRPAFQKMAAVGTVAFSAIGAGVFKATQQASDAQEVFNKFDVVFGDVSDGAERVAQDLRNNFGLAESSAKQLLSSTGDMLTGFGLSGNAALDLAERTNKLAVDLASFTNIEGGAERASAALTKALLGERESVKELGIAILEEDVKAKVESMRATGQLTDENDRQAKAIATLEIAYEQSKNAIGDFARTQDSLANQQRVLQQRAKELTEQLGALFIPIFEKIIEKISPIIEKISEWAEKNPELARAITIAALALAGLVAVVGALGLVLPAVITGFSLIISPVGLVVLGIMALIAVVVLVIKNWEKIAAKASEIWNNIKETITGFVESIVEKIKGWLDIVSTAWSKTWESIKELVANILGFIVGVILTALDFFFPQWQEKLQAVSDVAVAVFNFIKETVSSVWNATVNFISEQLSRLWGFFKPILTQIRDFWADVWEGVKNAFVGAFNTIKDTAATVVEWITEKIQWLSDKVSALMSPITELARKAKEAFGSIGSKVSGAFDSVVDRGRSALGLASGGIVTRPTFAMLGEGGEPEAVIPLSKLATAGGGANITININGGNYLSEDAGRMLGDQIIEVLRRNYKI